MPTEASVLWEEAGKNKDKVEVKAKVKNEVKVGKDFRYALQSLQSLQNFITHNTYFLVPEALKGITWNHVKRDKLW